VIPSGLHGVSTGGDDGLYYTTMLPVKRLGSMLLLSFWIKGSMKFKVAVPLYTCLYKLGLFSNTPLKLSKMFRYPPQTLHNVLIPPSVEKRHGKNVSHCAIYLNKLAVIYLLVNYAPAYPLQALRLCSRYEFHLNKFALFVYQLESATGTWKDSCHGLF
jgi:hypothetical protein